MAKITQFCGHPSSAAKTFSILFLLALLNLNQGCAWRAASTPERQVAELTKLARTQNQDHWPKEKPRPNHLELARELVARRFYQVALVQLAEARQTAGDKAEVYYLMGQCHLGLADYPKAKECFQQALAMNGRHAASHNGLGLALDRLGYRQAAWESYAKAIELDPARAHFHNNLGFSKLAAGHLLEAEKHLRDSLALNPDLQVAAHNLALCYAMQGRYPEAHALLQKYGTPAAAANNLGVFYDLNGDCRTARQYYRAALRLDANLRAAKQNLGSHRESP